MRTICVWGSDQELAKARSLIQKLDPQAILDPETGAAIVAEGDENVVCLRRLPAGTRYLIAETMLFILYDLAGIEENTAYV